MFNKRAYESELWYNHKRDYFATIRMRLFTKTSFKEKKMLIVNAQQKMKSWIQNCT